MNEEELTLKEWLKNTEDYESLTSMTVWLAQQEKSKLINIIFKLLRDAKQI